MYGTYFTADHFSFVVNPSGREGRRLNFHQTSYVPNNIGGRGAASHTYNDLPTSAAELARTDLFNEHFQREYAEVLVTMLARPFRRGSGCEGGAAKRSARACMARARRAEGHNDRRFDDLWRELPIHALLVFCLPDFDGAKEGDATVTVFVTDRFKYASASQQSAAVFNMPASLIHDDAEVETRIAEELSYLSWETMRMQAAGVEDVL